MVKGYLLITVHGRGHRGESHLALIGIILLLLGEHFFFVLLFLGSAGVFVAVNRAFGSSTQNQSKSNELIV